MIFYGELEEGGRGPDSVTVNAERQRMSELPLYQSPFLSAPWLNQSDEAGRIVIGSEQTGQLFLDFRNPDNPQRTEGPLPRVDSELP